MICFSQRQKARQGKQRRTRTKLRQRHQSGCDVLHNFRSCLGVHGRRSSSEFRILSEAKHNGAKRFSPELASSRRLISAAIGIPFRKTRLDRDGQKMWKN